MSTSISASCGLLMLIAAIPLAGCSDGQSSSNVTAPSEATGHSQETENHGPEGDSARSQSLVLSAAQIESAGLELASAGPAMVRESILLYGVIAPNAEQSREVAARFPGVIRSMNKRVGDAVRAGETLATVESNESLQSYAVIAPLSGVITARHANPGEQSGERTLFTVTDLSTVWVELALFPRDISRVRVGQTVRVRGADPALVTEGKVVYIAPFGQTANQTLTARVLIRNEDRLWPPGLYVSAEVTVAESAATITVRAEAIQALDEQAVVFVRTGRGFEPRSVRAGRSDGQVVEIIAGLAPREQYVARNSFILKAELGKGEAEHGH